MPERVEYTAETSIENMFPPQRLNSIDASPLVRSMTPEDLQDMQKAFTFPGSGTANPKVKALSSRDLQNIEDLFAEYRQGVIANYRGLDSLASNEVLSAAGSSCCCCCTPCCSCSSAATEISPFGA